MSQELRLASPDSDSVSDLEFSSVTQQRSDADLCEQIQQSSPDSSPGRAAFAELYSRHKAPALHVALRLNRDRSRAEDAVAEAFTKIWQAWGNGTGPNESFASYLMAAVRSESYRRKAITRVTAVVEPEVLAFLAGHELRNHADEAVERDQLGRAFKTLPESWQTTITMIDIDGVPISAAAEVMELSSNSFNSLLRRAREGLRVAYLQEHVEPSRPECAEYSADLARFVRGQLGLRRSDSLESHLSRCSHCTPQMAKLQGVNTAFQAWMTPAILAAALVKIEHFPASAVPSADESIWILLPESPSGAGLETGTSGGTSASAPPADSISVLGASGSGSSAGSLAGGTLTIKGTLACIIVAASIAATTVGIMAMQNRPVSPPPSAAGDSAVTATASGPTTDSAQDNTLPQPRASAAPSKSHGPQNDRSSAQESPRSTSIPKNPVGRTATESEQPSPPKPGDSDSPATDFEEGRPESSAAPPPQPDSESHDNSDKPQVSPTTPEEPNDASNGKSVSETESDGQPSDDDEASTDPFDPGETPGPSGESDATKDDSAEETPGPTEKTRPGEEESSSEGAATDSNDNVDGIHCHDFGQWYFCH